tara:strand:- start:513 stop:668 length:156 start_codon:yes stop_codon:yes gene_type:complete
MEEKGQVDIYTGKKIKKPIGQRKKKIKIELSEKEEPKIWWEKLIAWLNAPI